MSVLDANPRSIHPLTLLGRKVGTCSGTVWTDPTTLVARDVVPSVEAANDGLLAGDLTFDLKAGNVRCAGNQPLDDYVWTGSILEIFPRLPIVYMP